VAVIIVAPSTGFVFHNALAYHIFEQEEMPAEVQLIAELHDVIIIIYSEREVMGCFPGYSVIVTKHNQNGDNT
jgi:hypothetical protein